VQFQAAAWLLTSSKRQARTDFSIIPGVGKRHRERKAPVCPGPALTLGLPTKTHASVILRVFFEPNLITVAGLL